MELWNCGIVELWNSLVGLDCCGTELMVDLYCNSCGIVFMFVFENNLMTNVNII